MKSVYRFLRRDPVLLFILLCNLLFVISTHSTSFIEEEHMIWYFYWTSLLVVLITDTTKKTDIALIFSLLVLHRILRKLNQTGIQWDGLPDIGDWLSLVHNKPYLSIYTILGNIYEVLFNLRLRLETIFKCFLLFRNIRLNVGVHFTSSSENEEKKKTNSWKRMRLAEYIG